ncbi:MAG: hypothetical protein KJ622_05820 [Alphaproteobacteria bacterium]|nr:hypothetical protein [Alphaproteobacteria bacterium]
MFWTGIRLTGFPFAIAAIATLAAMASLYATGDGLLRAEFGTAFADPNYTSTFKERSQAQVSQPVAGSEDFWLGDARATNATPATWNVQGSLAIGNLISIAMNGVERTLEVVSVKEGPAGLLDTDVSTSGIRKSPLIVTLRPVGGQGRPVHLVIEAEEQLSGFIQVSRQPPHEL